MSKIHRRQAITGMSASALVAALHPENIGSRGSDDLPDPEADKDALIQQIRLQTSAPLHEMKSFYEDQIGFELIEESNEEITFRAGASKLTFIQGEETDRGAPFYHIAFNIPENKHSASCDWLKKKAIPIHSVKHFRHWNAHAVFFLDPAENLVEFIARHDLDNAASGDFSPPDDALCVSEIAFLVDDEASFSSELKKAFNVENFRGGHSVGTDHGILLVFKRGRQWHKPAETFPADVTISGSTPTEFQSKEYPYRINSISID